MMVTSDAPSAQVSLDGGPPAATPWIREVEPGKHRVEVSAEGYYPALRELTAIADELIPIAVPLRERPSTVTVWTDQDADLYVDGAFVGAGGDGVALPLPSGTHRLEVARKGHRIFAQTLELERGHAEELRIKLVPTTQRRASQALLVGGGAALGVGLVLSGLALRSESRAKDFLDRRARGNVSNADLSEYHTTTADRGRYRAAAAVSLASSVGLFLTGFFLYEMDQPNPQELNRPGRAPGAEQPGAVSKPTTSRLRLVPLPVAGGFEVTLHALF
jgi:hypothetical protein